MLTPLSDTNRISFGLVLFFSTLKTHKISDHVLCRSMSPNKNGLMPLSPEGSGSRPMEQRQLSGSQGTGKPNSLYIKQASHKANPACFPKLPHRKNLGGTLALSATSMQTRRWCWRKFALAELNRKIIEQAAGHRTVDSAAGLRAGIPLALNLIHCPPYL